MFYSQMMSEAHKTINTFTYDKISLLAIEKFIILYTLKDKKLTLMTFIGAFYHFAFN